MPPYSRIQGKEFLFHDKNNDVNVYRTRIHIQSAQIQGLLFEASCLKLLAKALKLTLAYSPWQGSSVQSVHLQTSPEPAGGKVAV